MDIKGKEEVKKSQNCVDVTYGSLHPQSPSIPLIVRFAVDGTHVLALVSVAPQLLAVPAAIT